MGYTTISFIVFAFFICFIYIVCPRKAKPYVLLAASVFFYALFSKLLIFYALGAVAVEYCAALLIQRSKDEFAAKKKELDKAQRKELKKKYDKKQRLIEFGGIAVMLLPLLVLKYSPLAVSAANGILGLFGSETTLAINKFALPLGISYYTLTGISYIADVRMGKLTAERNPLKVASFALYFPHIVEGPFSRYGELGATLFAANKADYDRILGGIVRIVYGFLKKMVLADRAGLYVDAVFAAPNSFGGERLLVAMIMYTIQIYADFSGVMDIVCGLSEVLGVRLPENFSQPFFSQSIDEFWRRWHITLGAWLRDYVFYPITFSKGLKSFSNKCREKLGAYYGAIIPASAALLAVWTLIGLWHGASVKYLVYGLYYYALMTIGKLLKPLTDKIKINRESKGWRVFSILRTDVAVLFGMTLFRAESVGSAVGIAKDAVVRFSFAPLGELLSIEKFKPYDAVVVLVCVLALLVIGVYGEKGVNVREKLVRKRVLLFVALHVMLIALVVFGVYGPGSGASPLIYGQF